MTKATIRVNEWLPSWRKSIAPASWSPPATCAPTVVDGSPVTGLGELDPVLPRFHTHSNGLGARHNSDPCFSCRAPPTLGGSGGFLVPNPVSCAT